MEESVHTITHMNRFILTHLAKYESQEAGVNTQQLYKDFIVVGDGGGVVHVYQCCCFLHVFLVVCHRCMEVQSIQCSIPSRNIFKDST